MSAGEYDWLTKRLHKVNETGCVLYTWERSLFPQAPAPFPPVLYTQPVLVKVFLFTPPLRSPCFESHIKPKYIVEVAVGFSGSRCVCLVEVDFSGS